MPDLRYGALQAWLQEHAPAVANGSLNHFGSHPGGRLSSKIVELGVVMDSALAATGMLVSSSLDTSYTKMLRLVLVHVNPAVRLRLLASLDTASTSIGPQALRACFTGDTDGYGELNRLTVDEFERLETLERVFAPERVSDLIAVCRQANLEGLSE